MIPLNPTPVGAAIALVGGKRAVVWLAWALLATLCLGVQSCRLSNEKVAGTACNTDRANFANVQTGHLETIGNLQNRIAVEAEKRRVEALAHTEALRLADEKALRADAARDLLTLELERLYAQDEGARAWGDIGVDRGVLDKLPGAKW